MTEYNQYMNSPEWAAVRRQVLDRARGLCERCGERARLEVHHKHYDSLGDEDLDDLEALCPTCHREADKDRETEAQARAEIPSERQEQDRMERRFRAWALAVFGPGWETEEDEDELREKFDRFLDEHD